MSDFSFPDPLRLDIRLRLLMRLVNNPERLFKILVKLLMTFKTFSYIFRPINLSLFQTCVGSRKVSSASLKSLEKLQTSLQQVLKTESVFS